MRDHQLSKERSVYFLKWVIHWLYERVKATVSNEMLVGSQLHSANWVSRFERIARLLARINTMWLNAFDKCFAIARWSLCAKYGTSELLPTAERMSQIWQQICKAAVLAMLITLITAWSQGHHRLQGFPKRPTGLAIEKRSPRRRNPVLNPPFIICSDVFGLRCLRSKTFSLSVRPCCYISSLYSPDCVSRCPQWIKHETKSACLESCYISHWVWFIL